MVGCGSSDDRVVSQKKLKGRRCLLTPAGRYAMVTGQSVVLWSRLHLIVSGEKGVRILRWTQWMIIVDAIVLHVPTTVLTFGCNGSAHTDSFVRVFNVYEKIQMVGFLYDYPSLINSIDLI